MKKNLCFASKPLRFWILLLGMLLAALAFGRVTHEVFENTGQGDSEAVDFDHSISTVASGLRNPTINQAMTDLTALGSVSVVFTFFFILLSVLAIYRDWKGMIYLTLIAAGAGAIPQILKVIFGRERPEISNHLVNVSDLSFPSGHSFGAAAIYLALAFYAGRYAKSWAQEVFFYLLGAIVIFLVGISRIFLGVHYPTDVLAGVTGGAAWAFGISAAYVFLTHPKNVPPEDVPIP
jgi:undecaprenyl-diphosphatase